MMPVAEDSTATADSLDDPLAFEAVDVTGSHNVAVSGVQRGLPAGVVATALARQMSLAPNTPWSLHDSRGAILDDERTIGEQVTPGEKMTIVPKAHLG